MLCHLKLVIYQTQWTSLYYQTSPFLFENASFVSLCSRMNEFEIIVVMYAKGLLLLSGLKFLRYLQQVRIPFRFHIVYPCVSRKVRFLGKSDSLFFVSFFQAHQTSFLFLWACRFSSFSNVLLYLLISTNKSLFFT